MNENLPRNMPVKLPGPSYSVIVRLVLLDGNEEFRPARAVRWSPTSVTDLPCSRKLRMQLCRGRRLRNVGVCTPRRYGAKLVRWGTPFVAGTPLAGAVAGQLSSTRRVGCALPAR